MGSDGPKGNKHCRVDGNAVLQQDSNNLLDQGDGFGRELRRDVVVGSILYIGAVCWMIPQVRHILGVLWDGLL